MKRLLVAALATILFAAACGKSKKPIIVGSKNDVEQTILGEIVAQLLERRLQTPVQRRLALGGTEILYQALITGEVSIYPEYSGIINTVILKENASPDAAISLERARAEMLRLAQAELIGPLGFANPPALVVRASDAPKIDTLSQAAEGKTEWKVGVSYEFQQRADGMTRLNDYRLPTSASVRSMDAKQLFPALEKGDVTMIAVTTTDGHLTSSDWKILTDDRKVFPPQQAVLLARMEILNQDPQIRAALSELSGKITAAVMRKLNSQVEVDKKPAAEVASAFLATLGIN